MTSAALPAALANKRPPTILSCWTEMGSALTRQKPGLRTNLQQAGSCLHPLSPARSIPTPPTAIFAWPLGTDQALEDSLKLPLPSSPSLGLFDAHGSVHRPKPGNFSVRLYSSDGGCEGLRAESELGPRPVPTWAMGRPGAGTGTAPQRCRCVPVPPNITWHGSSGDAPRVRAVHPRYSRYTLPAPAAAGDASFSRAARAVRGAWLGRAARSPPPTRPGAGAAAPLTRG